VILFKLLSLNIKQIVIIIQFVVFEIIVINFLNRLEKFLLILQLLNHLQVKLQILLIFVQVAKKTKQFYSIRIDHDIKKIMKIGQFPQWTYQ